MKPGMIVDINESFHGQETGVQNIQGGACSILPFLKRPWLK